MRRAVRAATKEGFERIAFVCGAYHAPVLDPATYPPQTHDNDLLTGLPRTKVAATWAPWSSGRLALASGYGAGVTSPGWYQHLFDHWSRDDPDDVLATGWLVRVARALRDQRLDASTASIVEASRLATTLAAVRGRPSVGLSELDDAAEAVLCEGSRVPLALVHDSLVVGRELGAVPERAPMVPLAADLARQQRALRLKPAAKSQTVVLDLRRPGQVARSVLLHRLRLLGVDWGTETDAGASTGTFKEAWELEWRPELAVAVIEAGLFGTTVASAAATKVAERAEAGRRPGHPGSPRGGVPGGRPARRSRVRGGQPRGAHRQAARRAGHARRRRAAGPDHPLRRRARRRGRRGGRRAPGPGGAGRGRSARRVQRARRRRGRRGPCRHRGRRSRRGPARRRRDARALDRRPRRRSPPATGCTARSPAGSTACSSTPTGSTGPRRPGG